MIGRIGFGLLPLLLTVACSSSGDSTSSSGGASATGGGTASGSDPGGSSGAAGSSSGTSTSSSSGSDPGSTFDGGGLGPAGGSPGACALAKSLRSSSSCHFLFGMGNDLNNDHSMDGAYTLGTTVDLHYAYLTGLPTKGGWPDWNTGGTFVNALTDSANKAGVTPMFTLYGMAAEGDGNFAMTTDDAAMNLYWQGAKLLFQRLAVFGKPAVVHLEPDFWAYAMMKSVDGTAKVIVSEHAADCAAMPDNLIGMASCLLKLARTYAPKVSVGFHVSSWGGTPAQTLQFFKAIHADQGDFIATDMLDRDAGCYEAHTDPNCQRTDGPWYWDETNQTSPNFHDHLSWVKSMTDGLKLPMVWWQVPFGVPSTTKGGTASHYRDNRVHYMFSHVSEFVAAGGLGAVFGTGAGNQTYIDTDYSEFKTAVATYFKAPVAIQ